MTAKVRSLIIALAMALAVAGCQSTQRATPSPSAPQAASPAAVAAGDVVTTLVALEPSASAEVAATPAIVAHDAEGTEVGVLVPGNMLGYGVATTPVGVIYPPISMTAGGGCNHSDPVLICRWAESATAEQVASDPATFSSDSYLVLLRESRTPEALISQAYVAQYQSILKEGGRGDMFVWVQEEPHRLPDIAGKAVWRASAFVGTASGHSVKVVIHVADMGGGYWLGSAERDPTIGEVWAPGFAEAQTEAFAHVLGGAAPVAAR